MEIVSWVTQIALPVTDPSHVGEARRAAKNLSERLDFSEEQAGKLAIVVTETATNLAKHARGGELLLCPVRHDEDANRIDVIAVDRGPGMGDVARSMDDGFSTAGTAGQGLGAIQRLAEKFEIYSQPGVGTALMARLSGTSNRRTNEKPSLNASFVCFAVRGEHVSGDTVAFRVNNGGGAFMVADGLGHGFAANEASIEAGKIFNEEKGASPTQLLQSINQGLRSTRGAAVAVATIDRESRLLRYSGIGNIAGAIFKGELSRSLISHNGIVGHQSPRVQEFTYEWPKSGILVMNSDGLVTNWKLSGYPGLTQKDPALIAAVLYRDYARGRDDVAILVVKEAADA